MNKGIVLGLEEPVSTTNPITTEDCPKYETTDEISTVMMVQIMQPCTKGSTITLQG